MILIELRRTDNSWELSIGWPAIIAVIVGVILWAVI